MGKSIVKNLGWWFTLVSSEVTTLAASGCTTCQILSRTYYVHLLPVVYAIVLAAATSCKFFFLILLLVSSLQWLWSRQWNTHMSAYWVRDVAGPYTVIFFIHIFLWCLINQSEWDKNREKHKNSTSKAIIRRSLSPTQRPLLFTRATLC